jgi:peptidylprolyl isomerase domain and WD repeat-containing protein 1
VFVWFCPPRFASHSRTNFIVTTSIDGHLKLWKKQEQGIEFVKHYRTSLKAIVGVSASEDGKMFATVSENGEGRVFDVVNFGEFVGSWRQYVCVRRSLNAWA